MSILDELIAKHGYKYGVELKAFIPTGYECNWPGCTNEAVKTTLPVKNHTTHCIKHQLKKHSGRVSSGNWRRDHYREHLKPYCEMSGKRWSEMYQEVKKGIEYLGASFTRIDLVRRTCQQFHVDHKNGDHSNNDPNNLQTLTIQNHKLKTEVMGDSVATMYRKNKINC